MATSLLDPVAQHAADLVQERGLGRPDRNALLAGVLAQRTSRSGLFSKDSKAKERDLRVFLFDCAIVLLAPKDKDKDGESGWMLFCDPIPIELLTLRALRPTPSLSTPPAPAAHRRSWFLDRLPASPISSPARAKTPPPLASPRSVPSSPQHTPTQDDFLLTLSSLGRKDLGGLRNLPVTLYAANAAEQRAWAQCVSTRQEDVRTKGRDGASHGWKLVPINLGPAAVGMGKISCYVDYDAGYAKARLWGTPEGLYEHILNAPNQQSAVRKILDLPDITHVLVMDFDERLMIVLVAKQTAYLAPFPSENSMLEVSRLKRIGTNITHIAAGVLVTQPLPLPTVGSSPPSAFIDPTDEKRERRKSATLTKPPPRAAVISGASSSKSDVQSALRDTREKDKDKESVRTTATLPVTATAPSIKAPATTISSATSSSLAPPAASTPTPRRNLSPSKPKEKTARRLSDIGIFALWRRKPEKDKASKEKPGKEKGEKQKDQNSVVPAPSTPPSDTARLSTATAESKPKYSMSSLKPGHGHNGPPLTKTKSATFPSSLMRLPSLEFDKDNELGANGSRTDATKGNGEGAGARITHEPFRQSSASFHDSSAIPTDETGALDDKSSPKPATYSQTLPSRSSTLTSGLGRGFAITRKHTADSNTTKPKEDGPPPKIQIALDFPSIAWPSVLDANNKNGGTGGDRFAGSDFLADVQRDLGDLVAGGLGMSLSEEKAGMVLGNENDGSILGRSRSPVPEAITEEPEKLKTPIGDSGRGNSVVTQEPGDISPSTTVASASVAQPEAVPQPSQLTPQIQMNSQPQVSPRSTQPQHTRFLVLSKSTTLSTSVKLYTVGGLKVEDDGDIGGGRLSLYKECYVPSQTFSIDFLKSRICFGGADGFEIMDPWTGKLEHFLDPVEMTEPEGPLGFLVTHPRRPKARAVFRVDQKFLCCYDEFAFFLDKFGKRTRENWLIRWLGTPTEFAVQYPYLFAFEPEFTEIRHCSTGELLQLIPQPSMTRLPAGEFIAPAQKQDGVPLRRVNGEILLESEGFLYALRPMQQ